jgi:hypothetical protein
LGGAPASPGAKDAGRVGTRATYCDSISSPSPQLPTRFEIEPDRIERA